MLLLLAILAGEALMLLLALQVLRHSFWWAAFWLLLAALVAIGLWFLRHRVLVEVAGDAARYLTAAPQNIAARARIRVAGMKLLAALHDSPDYDRIILVCHSLGTVIGYDLLNFYWSTVNGYFRHPLKGCAELEKLNACIKALHANPDDPADVRRLSRRTARLRTARLKHRRHARATKRRRSGR